MSDEKKACKSCGWLLKELKELGRKEPLEAYCENRQCPEYQKRVSQ